MYTLDASIFVRDATPLDADHAVCHSLIAYLHTAGIPIIVPAIILPEVAGALSRVYRDPLRARLTAEAISALPNVQVIPLDTTLAGVALEIAADRTLRGADSLYVAVARQHACTLISLDREQRERGAAVVPTQTPAEALADLERETPA